MKRRAFNLVELMVVIGIIAVLLAILLPAVSVARQHSRTAGCASNLHQIATALADVVVQGNGARPMAEAWPGQAMASVASPGIYVCPEVFALNGTGNVPSSASGVASGWGNADFDLSKMVYINKNRSISISFSSHPTNQKFSNISTFDGSDSRGPFIDIVLSDTTTAPDISGDCHDGWIRIYRNDGGSGNVTATLKDYACASEYNNVLYQGKPVFYQAGDTLDPSNPAYGWLGSGTLQSDYTNPSAQKKSALAGGTGMVVELHSTPCNYGMTEGAEKLPVGGKPWVMDYNERIVDPTLSDAPGKLVDSARHRSKLNVLMTDGSVQQFRADDPTFNPASSLSSTFWTP